MKLSYHDGWYTITTPLGYKRYTRDLETAIAYVYDFRPPLFMLTTN